MVLCPDDAACGASEMIHVYTNRTHLYIKRDLLWFWYGSKSLSTIYQSCQELRMQLPHLGYKKQYDGQRSKTEAGVSNLKAS